MYEGDADTIQFQRLIDRISDFAFSLLLTKNLIEGDIDVQMDVINFIKE